MPISYFSLFRTVLIKKYLEVIFGHTVLRGVARSPVFRG